MPKDIADFIESYRSAFNALDGATVASLYAVPSGIAHDGGYTHWLSLDAVRSNMEALCAQYRENGYENATCEVVNHMPLGDKFAITQVRWRVTRTEGREPWVFSTTYNLMRSGLDWQVLLCTAHEEKKLSATSEA